MKGRTPWLLMALLCILALSACGQEARQNPAPQKLLSNGLPVTSDAEKATPTPPTSAQPLVIPRQQAKATPTPRPTPLPAEPTATPVPTTVPAAQTNPPNNIPRTGSGAAPYGPPPPLTALERELTQKLFAQINSDRAARGLYPYVWNDVLAGGARLHSWNMLKVGYITHTSPDGRTQCQRIAAEGFAGYSDCGENIAYAGAYPTYWEGTNKIQQSMVNEPPTGWHRIHLFSTTLHRIGIGVVVSGDTIWFVEDMVS